MLLVFLVNNRYFIQQLIIQNQFYFLKKINALILTFLDNFFLYIKLTLLYIVKMKKLKFLQPMKNKKNQKFTYYNIKLYKIFLTLIEIKKYLKT